ncbi:MAG: imidazole glycerol phosphate synthase subunit HisH [Rhodospirillaceae bacterium]|jgi:imidazole glycerol-phosphate synthase subunit HisH|nr:imidazole glycerol phosphate synthase subunit HisH [Rhodospirillaceae bacterium]MBT4219315.1 imidazole glycerol phosphate synthase subunit HisH [Rhodospirillaceae bacterium]MBT5013731.1 imidazole glycerol phosphate synthase subunit HisH [Rhodospirillaceae bacterium]MBT5308453.1 imidazole glycerol phosphate synthase subunit HisH [Rhodospirillaceae bacterium]MBT6406653.1 imidazole glycerol phosphate synthase subunit HisH [Rhodospirillaceae bacterium]
MTVVIIDYGSGNLRSAAKAFERAADDNGLGLDVIVSDKPGDLGRASHIVLPGVGAFGDCRAGLGALDGMVDALGEAVISGATPFLGICVGMQLMADVGHEHGEHPGLGWIKGAVEPMTPDDATLKIPHMGWNELTINNASHPLFDDIDDGAHAYFVHGYHMVCENAANVLATTSYGGPVTAVIGRDNMVGTQFHPEKSQALGLKLIGNFLKWKP